MFISVIVASQNRCMLLDKALEALLYQDVIRGCSVEIIVVDHNSTDDTKNVVSKYKNNPRMNIRYVHEDGQTLSHARNRGIKESHGDILAFTDDDVLVDKGWIKSIYEAFQQTDCDALGGRVLPVYPEKTAGWIVDNYEFLNGPIVYRNHGNESRFYTKKMLPFVGANMAVRKSCFEEFGLFRTDIGAGSKFPYGEDVEFYQRISPKKIYYSAQCIVWHVHAVDRMNMFYIAKWFFLNGHGYARRECINLKKDYTLCLGMPRYLIRQFLSKLARFFVNIFHNNKRLKNGCRMMWALGRCYGAKKALQVSALQGELINESA